MRKLTPLKTYLVISALLVSLGGCTSLQQFVNNIVNSTVSPPTVYVAAQAFDAAEQTAANYLSLPLCSGSGPQVCRTAAGSAAIAKAIRAGRPIRNQLEAAINAGNGNAPVPASTLQLLLNSNATIQQAFAAYGVQ
jgi:hypothetical protein